MLGMWSLTIGAIVLMVGICNLVPVLVEWGTLMVACSLVAIFLCCWYIGVMEKAEEIVDLKTLLQANREHGLFFQELHDPDNDDGKPSGNVIFLPKGWCDEITFANGDASGPEPEYFVGPNATMKDSPPELYGYGPMYYGANSPVQEMWFDVQALLRYPQITEQEARKLHPKLFAYLNKINRGK